ncbi:hypothetical protein ACTXG5_10575 [Mycobacterium sp. Dal123C01]|uniref:hypothetical protein n=1 Tax=Mycobacterium sp. Dal123C01 TaxID=3457577 RepID=UPI00403EE18B
MQEIEKVYPPGIFGEDRVVKECTEPQVAERRRAQFVGKLVTRVEDGFGTRAY